MTVSPRWPQDGRQTPAGGGRPISSPTGDGSSDTPPTLFELPNLNPQPKVAAEQVRDTEPAAPIGPSLHQSSAADLTRADSPAIASEPIAADCESSLPIASVSRSDRQQLPAEDLEASIRSSEVPAGRGWMEAIQQHGVVVMLLLLVVGTALLTGRDDSLDQVGVPIVESVPETSGPAVAVAEVPIPDHTHDRQSGVTVAVEPAPSAPESVSTAAAPEELSGLTNQSVSAEAALDAPRSASRPHAPLSEREPLAQTQSLAPPARTVSDRSDRYATTGQPDPIESPSLETLLDNAVQTESAQGESAATASASATPLFSRTPAGISDWIQYLPPLQPAVSNH